MKRTAAAGTLELLMATTICALLTVRGCPLRTHARRYTALYSAVSMNNSLALGMFMIAIYVNNIGLTGQVYECVLAGPSPPSLWRRGGGQGRCCWGWCN